MPRCETQKCDGAGRPRINEKLSTKCTHSMVMYKPSSTGSRVEERALSSLIRPLRARGGEAELQADTTWRGEKCNFYVSLASANKPKGFV